ncbi:UDP-glucose 4-epimerase [bacterium (Candidatus Gribaldobacteria) CG23_combo_of_CG06-09_8_20_14_all_37_87_8]|uniref:UDP-glucose 4-epimerase n=1 Tax=bacterium (Candidatus Gribaldobacteria) CG23_combo_of_CG06-09_8_20_14_all_37_87_8 TaxID=2014278 RepID=A0A2G9ZHW2_9BACT|nr:MAG: UDP-glucose 4-epimerase [bacterium (Candidatus Gribaldobacteria) CG23_combo_of_CG06-09_8_20_14_all_37_87_8]
MSRNHTEKFQNENLKRFTVLVTGAAGFIGSHLVDELVVLNHQVIAVDDLSGGYKENVNPNAIFIQASVVDYNFINKIFDQYRPRFVYHLAAYAAEGLSHFIRRFNYTNNLVGTANIVNACVNYNTKHLVFTSSIAVYGGLTPPVTEKMTPQPEDPYGIAKYAAEQDIKLAWEMFGLPYTIFRPHNVYGERQNVADRYRNVIGIFMNQLMLNKPLTVFGNGEQSRGFTYIKDISGILAKAPLNPKAKNQIFNLGAEQPITINQLIVILNKVMGVEPIIRYLPARHEVMHAFASHQKVRRAFHLTDGEETPIELGLTKMWHWVRCNGARKTPKFKNIEIEKNIPSIWLKN